MTTPEFRDILQRDTLGPIDGSIVINYNTSGSITTIDDIAVVIGQSDLTQLQEATSLTLLLPQDRTVFTINVDNSISPRREVDRGRIGRYFLYSILTPQQRPIITGTFSTASYNTDVAIDPNISTGVYEYNAYNAVIGNSAKSRESDYIVDCDRGSTTNLTKTNPTNIFNILDETALPAEVQDSLYSNTGWINARYEGTKLEPANNSGVDPVLQGTFFEAAFFGISASNADIQAILPADLTFNPYLSSGEKSPPEFVTASEALIYSIQGTVVEIASEGKLLLRQTRKIIRTSPFGYLISGSGSI